MHTCKQTNFHHTCIHTYMCKLPYIHTSSIHTYMYACEQTNFNHTYIHVQTYIHTLIHTSPPIYTCIVLYCNLCGRQEYAGSLVRWFEGVADEYRNLRIDRRRHPERCKKDMYVCMYACMCVCMHA